MILGYDLCTEKGVIWGIFTYICRQMDNFERKKEIIIDNYKAFFILPVISTNSRHSY